MKVNPMFILLMLSCLLCYCQKTEWHDQKRVQNEEGELTTQSDNDSSATSASLFSVPYIPKYVRANGYESSDASPARPIPFLLEDDVLLSGVYSRMLEDERFSALMQQAIHDSVELVEKYQSSFFLYLANPGKQRQSLYALGFYKDEGGIVYSICGRSIQDTSEVMRSDLTSSFLGLLERVAAARVPSRDESTSGENSPAIISFLVRGEPQVVVEPHAEPYHRMPMKNVPKWAIPHLAGRKMIDSLIWGIAEMSCQLD